MTYPITGIRKSLGPGEQVPLRREIDEWWDSKDKNDLFQKSLYIYALNEFKKMDPKDQMSFFAIAGLQSSYPSNVKHSYLTSSRYSWSAPGSLGHNPSQIGLVLYAWDPPFSAVAQAIHLAL